MPFSDATPMYRKTPYSTGMGMYCGHGKNTALTRGRQQLRGPRFGGKYSFFFADPPNIYREGVRMGKGECFTFRIGARKTEIPVSTKTMIPVTLCSLQR